MRVLITTAVLLLFYRDPLCLAANQSAQESLIAAEQQSSLFRDSSSPIRLEVSFTAQQDVPVQGHLTWIWSANDRWWRKVSLGDFQEIEVRNGEKLYTSRNLEFTPFRIGELIGLLRFTQSPATLTVKKQKQRMENGVEVTCVQVKPERGGPHDICFSSKSRDILSDDWKEPPDEIRREQYEDYTEFGTHRYPQRLELLVNGSKAVQANVDRLIATTFDEVLLTPPKGAIERRQCRDMKHAVPVSTPDPMYPKSASDNSLGGDTIVSMTVLTDGSVADIQLIGRAAHSMDEATLQTLKRWRFKPAMCGSEPVVSDIQVEVSFRME